MRTEEQHEVDFVLVCDDVVKKSIEVKLTNTHITPSQRYFYEKYNLPSIQVVKDLKQEKREQGIDVVKALEFLKGLRL